VAMPAAYTHLGMMMPRPGATAPPGLFDVP
jgi:hypothetical protein